MNRPVVPKYIAVHDELLSRLKAAQYSVGTRLPSEEALATTFGVSRVTIRKSLEILVDAGYLVSRQGSGYHVASLSPPQATCLVSFTDAVLRAGRVPGAKMLRIDAPMTDPPPEITGIFASKVACIRRLRTVDGIPALLVNTWVPMALVPGLSRDAFPESGHGQSILRILAERFDLKWSRACETVQSCATPRDVAEILGVAPGTPILTQACTAYDDDQAPVFHDQVYRTTPITYNLVGASRTVEEI